MLRSSSSLIRQFSSLRSVIGSPRWFSSAALSSSSTAASSSSFTSEHSTGYNSMDHYFEADRIAPGSTADPTNRATSYFINGTGAFVYASLARVLVVKFVSSMAASADVLAVSSLEVDLSPIAEGTSVTVKWRGKPVFIRHRNSKEIASAKSDDSLIASFRHPEKDAERVKDDKWMITLGICTHLGCVPIPNAGDYNGWFCPCHGSHYDTSGRIRKGPAPLNLEVPEYKFIAPTKIILG